MIGLHWSLAVLAAHIRSFGSLVKGNPILLIKDGRIQQQGVREAGLSGHDLEQALRLQAQETDASRVQLAYLERNGAISVIPCKQEPRVLEVSVGDGVQTVRIELE
jgi:uncharacterized membrane protein YcaP (DUF421 family)